MLQCPPLLLPTPGGAISPVVFTLSTDECRANCFDHWWWWCYCGAWCFWLFPGCLTAAADTKRRIINLKPASCWTVDSVSHHLNHFRNGYGLFSDWCEKYQAVLSVVWFFCPDVILKVSVSELRWITADKKWMKPQWNIKNSRAQRVHRNWCVCSVWWEDVSETQQIN